MLEEQQKLPAQIHPINDPLAVVDEKKQKMIQKKQKIINKQNVITLPNPNDDSKVEKPRQDFKRMTRRFYSNKITILRIKLLDNDDNQGKQNDITKLDIKELKPKKAESDQKSLTKISSVSFICILEILNYGMIQLAFIIEMIQQHQEYIESQQFISTLRFQQDSQTKQDFSNNNHSRFSKSTIKAIINYLLNHDYQIIRII